MNGRRMSLWGGWAAMLALAASPALAQSLGGLWGSPLYRVELAVSGTAVTGTFTPTTGKLASPGTIKGQMKPDGRSFTAQWTFTANTETATFSTWLQLAGHDRLLTGYRWSEEAPPSSFALHRAVNGQVPDLPDETTVGGTPPPSSQQPPPTPPTPPSTPGPGKTTVEVTICERVQDGEPVSVGTEFTSPKSVSALVRYNNLPKNSSLSWAWTLDGRQEANLTKALSGTGWHYHGLQSQTALVPGTYQLIVSLNGKPVAQRIVLVRGTAAPPTPPATATPAVPNIEVIICESVVDGEPRNRGTTFTKPRSVACLLKYRNLPQQSQLKWVWTRSGQEVGRHLTYVSGTGWIWHGLSNPQGLTPGTYEVATYARGELGAKIMVTVK